MREEVGQGVMDRSKALHLPGRFKAPHHFLTHPHGLVRILRPIVKPLVLTMFKRQAHRPVGGAITS
jgi:hypothetical protein